MEETESKYKEFLMRPSKYGPVKVDKDLEKLKITNKEPFRLVNSK